MKFNNSTTVILVSLFALSFSSGFSQSGTNFTKLESSVLSSVRNIVILFRKNSNLIWPGFDMSKQPFLVYIPDKWALLVNCNKKTDDFTEYPKNWPDIHTEAVIHFGNYKNLTGQLEFNVSIDSVTAVAIGFPEGFYPLDDLNVLLQLFAYIVHESFHQYQHEHFGEIPWAREEKYPILNAENTAQAYLEMQILMDALKEMDRNNRDECLRLGKEFAAVRQERWDKSDKFVMEYEQGQEINEGTAKYVEVKSVFQAIELAKHRNSDLDQTYIEILKSDEAKKYLYQNFEQIMSPETILPDNMIRNRIYPVGAAEGILLDYLGINWKIQAEKAGPDFSFSGIIRKTLCKDQDSIPLLSEKARNDHSFQDILIRTQNKINEYTEQYEKDLSSFTHQKGTRIEVEFNYTYLSRSSTSKEKKWVMDNGTKSLCVNYRIFKLQTKQLSLNIQDKAVFQNNDWDKKYAKVSCYSEKIPSLFIDGKPESIENLSEKEFSDIQLNADGIEVKCNAKGKITGGDNTLLIRVMK